MTFDHATIDPKDDAGDASTGIQQPVTVGYAIADDAGSTERTPEQEAETRAAIQPLAKAFRLQDRSREAARVSAIVRSMRLPFPPQIAAMGDLYETAETGRLLLGQKQVGCLLLDPTGCGKTTAAEAFAEVLAVELGPDQTGVVHCRVPANGTALGLYANALIKLGDRHVNHARESRLLTQLLDRLGEVGTRLLVIDEAQQGAGTSGLGGQVAAAIKMILDAGVVPVAILGTEKAVGVLAKDQELAGRLSAPSSLAPLSWRDEDDRQVWLDLLSELDRRLVADGACDTPFGLDEPDLSRRMIEACNGTIGQLMSVVRTAVREMARGGRRRLDFEDLVFGVDGWALAYGFISHNPLVMD